MTYFFIAAVLLVLAFVVMLQGHRRRSVYRLMGRLALGLVLCAVALLSTLVGVLSTAEPSPEVWLLTLALGACIATFATFSVRMFRQHQRDVAEHPDPLPTEDRCPPSPLS